MVGTLLGSGVIKWSGMVTVGDACDFDALPTLIVVFRILVPMMVGIPAVFLIPVRAAIGDLFVLTPFQYRLMRGSHFSTMLPCRMPSRRNI